MFAYSKDAAHIFDTMQRRKQSFLERMNTRLISQITVDLGGWSPYHSFEDKVVFEMPALIG